MKFRYLILLMIIFSGNTFSSEKQQEAPDLDSFVSNYYLNPQPSEAVKFLKVYVSLAAQYPNGQAPLNVFFSRILEDNPKVRSDFAQVINSAPETSKKAVLVILKIDHKSLLAQFEPSPGRNDALWGSFFASGKEEYLEGLFNAAQLGSDLKDLNKYVIGGSARWSICSNAKDHKRIRSFLLLKAKDVPNKQLAEALLSGDPAEFRAKMIETIRKQREKGVW